MYIFFWSFIFVLQYNEMEKEDGKKRCERKCVREREFFFFVVVANHNKKEKSIKSVV
jgi:hypothetical protein